MVVKVSIPNRFHFKAVPSFRKMLFQKEGEIHYIGGADIAAFGRGGEPHDPAAGERARP